MQAKLSNLVHPILAHGLRLKQRLEKGESPDLDAEQAALKMLLLSELESRRWVEFGGETRDSASYGDADRGAGELFLGVRYALVCWLDEIFISDSPWQDRWNERKLEVELYGTNDRAWRFWEQARLAEERLGNDVLEAFFLIVMLGFYGELRGRPDELQNWLTRIRTRVAQIHGQEWPNAAEVDPPTRVQPLSGREQFQRMLLVAQAVLLILMPLVTFVVVRKLAQ